MVHILIIIDPGGNFLAAHLLCQQCTDDVHILVMCRTYGNEQVCSLGTCLLERFNGGGIPPDGNYICHLTQLVEAVLIRIYNCKAV